MNGSAGFKNADKTQQILSDLLKENDQLRRENL